MTIWARPAAAIERGRGKVDDEQRLVQRAALEGDHAAYAQLVSKYANPVFRLAARFAGTPEAVNDLAELVFLRAWERFDQWDQLADFHTWLYQVAIETCLEHANGPGKHLSASDYTIDDLVKAPRDRSQAEIVMTRADLINVYKELEKLPPPTRAVVVLRALEGASYRELSTILRQPVSTVDTWMRHGLASLKGPLSQY